MFSNANKNEVSFPRDSPKESLLNIKPLIFILVLHNARQELKM